MTYERKRVAPRRPTPSTRGRETGPLTTRLPADLVEAQLRRFELFTGVGAGLWTLAFVMDGFVLPATVGVVVPRATLGVEGLGALISIGVFLYVRYGRCTAQT